MEYKSIRVYEEELKFLYIEDEKALQDKFDLLFTSSKLMGYKFRNNFKAASDVYGYRIYVIRAISDSKHFLIEFDLMNYRVIDMCITSPNGVSHLNLSYSYEGFINTDNFLDNEKDVLVELDKLLSYI